MIDYKIIHIEGDNEFVCDEYTYEDIRQFYRERTPMLLLIDKGSRKFYSVDYLFVPESANQYFVFEGEFPIYWGKDNIISNANPFKGEDDYAKFHISRYER